jgi:hypothetical protein
MEQIAILLFSCSSIFALSNKKYKLGFILGLCGQPFWFYTSYQSNQWGIFLVSIWFTISHINGLIKHQSEDSSWEQLK